MFVAIAQALSLDRCDCANEGFCDSILEGYEDFGCFDCLNSPDFYLTGEYLETFYPPTSPAPTYVNLSQEYRFATSNLEQ
jgi:hypothetical protein